MDEDCTEIVRRKKVSALVLIASRRQDQNQHPNQSTTLFSCCDFIENNVLMSTNCPQTAMLHVTSSWWESLLLDGDLLFTLYLRKRALKSSRIASYHRQENILSLIHLLLYDGDLNFLIFCKLIFTNSRMRFDISCINPPSSTPPSWPPRTSDL